MFKNLNELRDWHSTQVAKYSRLSEINRSAASDKRNEHIIKKLEKCAHNQDELVAVHDAAVSILTNPSPESKPDSWYDVEVIDALVRRLDVAINGEKGAARQAMLCDLVAQLEVEELPVKIVKTDIPVGTDGVEWNKTQAGYAHVESMVSKANGDFHGAPWWHGWAIREAFVAGAEWQDGRKVGELGIPANDPIFYFVAQHYPLTAQVVERIYRECTHHCESREANHDK